MTFSGRRPKDRNFVVDVRIASPECFRSRFVYCFRSRSHRIVYTPRSSVAVVNLL